ncbi:hypothetical protein A2U01_0118272, partial [Trifolium medium]|nr:hypothetical protein [Trifolium medium]
AGPPAPAWRPTVTGPNFSGDWRWSDGGPVAARWWSGGGPVVVWRLTTTLLF